jgi:tetraacyldisaccharide 4'-kinase
LSGRFDWWHGVVRGDRRGAGAILARAGLRAAAVPYGLAVRLRNAAFDRGWKEVHRAGVPVVSVGNLTLGGTGKTPAVEYVARLLRERDLRVVMLSRGYGAEHGPNDEAMVLEENCPDVPHLQGKDRVELAKTAVEELEAEVLVLDDGFQHRRLHRDLDVVLIDATRPPRDDHVFPGGTLREPAGGLKRAGVVLVTRCDQADPGPTLDWLTSRFPGKPVATSVHEPVDLVREEGDPEPAATLRGRRVGAVSGIGNPVAFRRTLGTLGADVVDDRVFPDHHGYTRADVDSLGAWAESLPANAVVATTQKDFVKLRLADLAGRPVRAVRIGLKFLSGEADFRAAVNGVI